MNKIFEKLKAINWKSKKSIIAYAIILAIIVGGTGTGLALKHFNNSSDIVKTDIDVKDKATSKPADDKKEDKKSDNKKDTDKKAESSKPTENKEEDKKDTNETSKTEDNKTNSNTNKAPVNNNNTNSNNNTSNSGNTSTPPTNNGGNTGNSGGNTTPQPPAHQHSWVEVYETITHEEQGHYEQVPIYETKAVPWCNICEKEIKGESPAKHNKDHMMNGEINAPNGSSGHRTEYIQVIVGYDDVWVVDVPAYPEQVLKGYTCSCGATK